MYKSVGLSVDEQKHANTPTNIITDPVTINNVGRAKLKCGDISNTLAIETLIHSPNISKIRPMIYKIEIIQ